MLFWRGAGGTPTGWNLDPLIFQCVTQSHKPHLWHERTSVNIVELDGGFSSLPCLSTGGYSRKFKDTWKICKNMAGFVPHPWKNCSVFLGTHWDIGMNTVQLLNVTISKKSTSSSTPRENWKFKVQTTLADARIFFLSRHEIMRPDGRWTWITEIHQRLAHVDSQIHSCKTSGMNMGAFYTPKTAFYREKYW